MLNELRRRKIGNEGMQLAALQRIQQRLAPDNAAPREIDQDAAIVHPIQPGRIDKSFRSFDQRHVNGDDIGFLEKLVQRIDLLHTGRQLPGTLHRDLRIVTDHLHAERQRHICNLDANGAKADYS